MATTAAGVAVGSAVGHTVGAAITGAIGGGSSHAEPDAAAPAPAAQPAACSFENESLVRCLTNNPNDISLCQSYVDMLNQCRRAYGAQVNSSY